MRFLKLLLLHRGLVSHQTHPPKTGVEIQALPIAERYYESMSDILGNILRNCQMFEQRQVVYIQKIRILIPSGGLLTPSRHSWAN